MPTCCGIVRDTSSPVMVTIRGPFRITSGIEITAIRSGPPSYHRHDSRTFGEIELRLPFCVACGNANPEHLQQHHLIARANGGTDDETNLITLCVRCHGKAHNHAGWSNDHHALAKRGLAAAKARGVRLGNPQLEDARRGAVAANKKAADAFAANVRPIIREIQTSGISSFQGIARALAARGVRTARGGQWTARMVINVLERPRAARA